MSDPDWTDANRRALQDVARAAREAAARPEVSESVATSLERGADKLLSRIPADTPVRENRDWETLERCAEVIYEEARNPDVSRKVARWLEEIADALTLHGRRDAA